MSRLVFETDVEATMAAVSALCEQIEGVCTTEALAPELAQRLVLVIEELTSNVVRHGFRGEPGRIHLRLETTDSALRLEVVDAAPPFDPLQQAAPDLDIPVEDRPIGGLGLHLVRSSVDEFTYKRSNNENRTRAVLRARPT